jgi:hypothetical protein
LGDDLLFAPLEPSQPRLQLGDPRWIGGVLQLPLDLGLLCPVDDQPYGQRLRILLERGCLRLQLILLGVQLVVLGLQPRGLRLERRLLLLQLRLLRLQRC